jgi:MFS transporter, DHA2 family, multidrug resistance protein
MNATDAVSTNDQQELRIWIGVLAALIGAFMAILDIQITNSSLQEIQGSLGATLEEGSWISTSYLVAEIIVIPLTGWLGQVFSLRRYLLVNTILFVLLSILCGFAQDLPMMIVMRAAQGFTGGTLIPTALTIILTRLPRERQTVGFALFGMVATFAPSIGPTIGGWLTENFGWQYIFYINFFPGLLVLAGTWYGIAAEPTQLPLLRKGDWWGISTMAIGLGCLTVVLEEGNRKDWFGSSLIMRLSIVAAVALAMFFWIELRSKNPFINLRLLKRRNFALTATVNLALGLGTYGTVYLLPLYLAQIQGYNALQIGTVMMWAGFPQLLLAPLMPALMARLDARLLIGAGAGFFALSCFVNTGLSKDFSGEQLIVAQLLQALAQPLLYIPLSSVATADIEPEQAGSASGLFNMTRNLGGSFGIALLATLLTRREQFHSNRLGETISLSDPQTAQRLNMMTQYFTSQLGDPVAAANQAALSIDLIVRREAFIMAYSDCYRLVGIGFVLSILAVILLKKVTLDSNANVGH